MSTQISTNLLEVDIHNESEVHTSDFESCLSHAECESEIALKKLKLNDNKSKSNKGNNKKLRCAKPKSINKNKNKIKTQLEKKQMCFSSDNDEDDDSVKFNQKNEAKKPQSQNIKKKPRLDQECYLFDSQSDNEKGHISINSDQSCFADDDELRIIDEEAFRPSKIKRVLRKFVQANECFESESRKFINSQFYKPKKVYLHRKATVKDQQPVEDETDSFLKQLLKNGELYEKENMQLEKENRNNLVCKLNKDQIDGKIQEFLEKNNLDNISNYQ